MISDAGLPAGSKARELEPGAPNSPDRPSPFPAGRIEHWIGRPASTWTADDLLAFARASGIRLVNLMHAGGDGWLKTLDFAPRDENHFRTILNGGERADGSSLFPGIRTDASDVILRPRIDTAFVDPFSPHPALAILCGHDGADGKPLPMSPDTILHRAHAYAREMTGVDLWALGEVEFFVGRRFDGDRGYEMDDHGYHATAPFVFAEDLRRLALVHLAAMGVPVKYGHSEVGAAQTYDTDRIQWEQHEVELALQPLPRAADAVTLTAWVLRNIAHRHGVAISFEPMLREGHPGNGLHFHVSPRLRDGHADILDGNGALTDPARWIIGGLVQMGGALMAFGNRVPGSFTRLTQGKEAPTSVTWGHKDRKALIRIPIVARDANLQDVSPPTVEFRLPDGSAHQYLLLAGLAQALVVGHGTPDLADLLERTAAPAATGKDRGVTPIPASAAQVALALESGRAALEPSFPPELIDRTLAALRG